MFTLYFSLRKRIYAEEVKHWLKQIEHLLALSVMFLGTALPALFFTILLAYGVIFDKQSSLQQTLILVWSLLLFQTILIMLCKPAILGTRYQLFLANYQTKYKYKVCSDFVFAVVSNPTLFVCLFVLLSISPSNWDKVIHGFLLLSMLIFGTYSSLYTSAKMHFSMLVTLVSLPLLSTLFPDGQFFAQHWDAARGIDKFDFAVGGVFLIMICSQMLYGYLHRIIPPFTVQIPIQLKIWWHIFVGENQQNNTKPNSVVLVCMLSMLVIMLCVYTHSNLPQFPNIVSTIGAQVLVLLCACLQLRTNKVIDEHAIFFAQYNHKKRFFNLQFALPCITFLLFISLLALLLNIATVFLSMLAFMICMLAAKVRPQSIVFAWMCSCFISAGLGYLLI